MSLNSVDDETFYTQDTLPALATRWVREVLFFGAFVAKKCFGDVV